VKKALDNICLALFGTLLLVVMASCERRPLEVVVEKGINVRINVDWASRFGQRPTGMTVRLYPADGSAPITNITNDVDGVDVRLNAGTYYLLVFNQTEDEFGSMTFSDMQYYSGATAHSARATLHGKSGWDDGVDYYADPEPIGVAVDTISISQDMVDDAISYKRYKKGMTTGHYYEVDTTFTFDEVALPMTTRLNVIVHIKGIGNMRSVTGYITGMADGFTLYSGHRLNTACVLPLEGWKGAYVDKDANTGIVTTSTATFGLPFDKEVLGNRVPEDNRIVLCFTLVDGTTRVFTYDVAQYIHYRNSDETDPLRDRYSMSLELDLVLRAPLIEEPELPDVKPDEKGSGFDAEVNPWEDGGTIDVGV
jgi:hypothetical protein